MKNKLFKIILASLPCLSLATGCINKGNGKIKLTIGFWPESTETKDVAMYKTWKENFEKDYPEYEIVASPYTYATDTVGSKYETDSLPTVFQTWFTEPSKLVQKKIYTFYRQTTKRFRLGSKNGFQYERSFNF